MVRRKLYWNTKSGVLFPLFVYVLEKQNKANPVTKYAWKGSCSVWCQQGTKTYFFLYQQREVTLRLWHWSCLVWYRFWNCSVIRHFLMIREVHENFHKLASLSSDLCGGEKGRKPQESKMINCLKQCIMKKIYDLKSCLKHASTGDIRTSFIYYV